MQFSVKALLIATLATASLLAFYRIAPVLCLSVVLLAPFPMCLLFRRKRLPVIGSLLFFYVGSVGPISWFLTASLGLTVASFQAASYRPLETYMSPIGLLGDNVPMVGEVMRQYQLGWMALGKV